MGTRVLLADDHLIVRQGIKSLLEARGFEVVGETGDGQDAVRLARELAPEVAVLDYGMPSLNGIDVAREIHKSVPRTRTILLTMHTEDNYVLDAVRAGLSGFVVKSQAAEDLVQAIVAVSKDGIYLSPGISRTVVQSYRTKSFLPPDPLSDRERQVLCLIVDGHSTKQIAARLEISVKTAETHRANLMSKLGIHEVAGLVRYAIRRGLVEP